MAGRTDTLGTGKTLNLVVDEVPYEVKIEAFTFNEEKRYNVTVNGGDEHVFAWDLESSSFRAIDDDAADLSDVVEQAISQRLITEEGGKR